MLIDTQDYLVASKREGFRAALSGKAKISNPYIGGTTSRRIWDQGYREGLKLREFLWAS